MANKYEWFARKRNYDQELQHAIRIPTSIHPLKQSSTTASIGISRAISQSSRSSSTTSLNTTASKSITASSLIEKEQKFVDPLGVALAAESAGSSLLDGGLDSAIGDPLSGFRHDSTNSKDNKPRRHVMDNTLAENGEGENGRIVDDGILEGFEPWSSKRSAILQKYTTNEKLSIVTSFLPGGIPIQAHVTVTDKLKHRLEQLDTPDSSECRHSDLNQKEYIEKINELNRELLKAWRDDQRVQAIKIVIQCAKLLSNTTAASHFYPSQFVLITDVLDTFGRLVYDRLYTKAVAESPPAISSRLSQSKTRFAQRSVPESTKETCRNWFYKIASIRELLPRFYVETCILTSMRYIADLEEQQRTLVRLAGMIRGFSDPLVAAYARVYLCRIGMNLDPNFKEHIWRCFHDTMTTFDYSLSKTKHADLYAPAFDWIVQCLTYNSTQFDLGPIFEYCRQKKSTLLLSSCIKSTPSKLLVEGVESPLDWIRLIRECRQQKSASINSNNNVDHERIIFGDMIRALGKAVISHEPPHPDDKLRLLNEAWKLFMRDPSLEFYLQSAQVWFEFACRHFGPREINTLLDDIVRKCASTERTPTNSSDERSMNAELFHVLEKILLHLLPRYGPRTLFERVPQFVHFLDLLRADDIRRRQACERILSSLCEYLPVAGVDDSELANHVLQLCRTVHDGGLNEASSSFHEDKRHLGRLICLTLDRFDFCGGGDEFTIEGAQKQLEFLVDCRGYFCNLDDVQAYVVHRFNVMALKAGTVRARTRKTASFVRACIANSYITIPSIGDDHFVRLKLYLESATAALSNNCLLQADALLKACISLIPEVPTSAKVSEFKHKPTETKLLEFVQELMSLLLVVPDSPEERDQSSGGVYLYLFEGLLNAVRRYPWPENSDGKFQVFLNALRFLSTALQPEFPYKIQSVESNDTLYGGDARFIEAVRSSSNAIVQEQLDYLKKFDATNVQQKRRQTLLALDFVECILAHGDLERDSVAQLAWNLWNLAKKNAASSGIGSDHERQSKVKAIVDGVTSKYRFGKAVSRSENGHWAVLAEKFQPF